MWSMKKVLIVFNHPAPYKVRLFNELSKSFDLHVIFERDSASDRNKDFYFENKYDFIVHHVKGIKVGRENLISCGVKRHLKKNKYDLVIMNGYSQISEMIAIRYLKKHKIPYVLYINGGTTKTKECFIRKSVKKHYISGAKCYFSPDEQSNKYLVYYGANESEILNYPYSTIYESEIIKDKPDKTKLRKELSLDFEKVFVSSGQLIKRKNYLSLVNEWSNMPRTYGLVLIGDGKQRVEIENTVKELNLTNVRIIGFLKRDEMFKYFKASDAFLFPSKEDIYGHVINEAFSQGLPVISTNKVNSATKLVKNGENGYLLDKLEGKELQETIEKVLKLDSFKSCISVAKENTIEKMAKRHVEMFEEAMK